MKLLMPSLSHFFRDIKIINLETSMRGSDFKFDSVKPTYYKCHKVNFKHGGSYVDFPDWIKRKKQQ